ncbi:MAG: hypothetical protein H0T43_06245 [Solirubrobacterales bacterium]|nr:hypothetical protein [Solirubrobacterales bacterium]
MIPFPCRLVAPAVALIALVALPAPAALAAPDQASIMMDDDQLLYRTDNARGRALTKMKGLGVDAVRVTVLWRVVAEGADPTAREIRRERTDRARARARRQKARFDPDDPKTYPTRNWDRYDNLVKDASRMGIRVLFDVTGPGPRWAHRNAPPSQRSNQATFKPYPTRFRDFVEAVGKRYSGGYRDENAGRGPLPRVNLWSIWNEPNQAGWLSPQFERRQGQLVPASPALYRRLFHAGRQALESTGHGGDPILIGETAPLGSNSRGARTAMRPGLFLRELVCVAQNGTRYGGADAARRDCDDFARRGPLRATGYAHHPYTRRGAPTRAPRNADDLTIANSAALGTLLDTLSAQSAGALPSGLPLFYTEFGYESNPPDPLNGIPVARQADYNQVGEFLAYTDPRVKAMTQFLLRDVAPVRRFKKGSKPYWFTFQSGLFYRSGRAKPAAFAYSFPFIAFKQGPGQVGFWGQLRFRPDGSPDVAVIQTRPNAQTPWAQLGPEIATNPRGFFTASSPAPSPTAEYRAVYVDPVTLKVANASLATKP